MTKRIRVCQGPHCSYRGAGRIMETLVEFFKINKNETADLGYCPCTNFCEDGPNVVVDEDRIYHEAQTKNIVERLETEPGELLVQPNEEVLEEILKDVTL